MPAAGVHTTIAVDNNANGYDNLISDPTMRTPTDDEINTLSYEDKDSNYGYTQPPAIATFNFRLQAEQTYLNYTG